MTYKVFYLRRLYLLVSIGIRLHVGSVKELRALFPCPDRLSATWSTAMERRGVREKYWNLQTTCGSGALESETGMRSWNPRSLHWDAERSVPRRPTASYPGKGSSEQKTLPQASKRVETNSTGWPLTSMLAHSRKHSYTQKRARVHTRMHTRARETVVLFISPLCFWASSGPGHILSQLVQALLQAQTRHGDVLLTHQRLECAVRLGEHFLT